MLRRRTHKIYRYRIGWRLRRADPVVVDRMLAMDPEYLPRHLVEAKAGDLEAINITAKAVCRAFGLELLDDRGKGITLARAVTILDNFETWLIALRTKHDTFIRMADLHSVDVSRLDPERLCALWFARRSSAIRKAEVTRTSIAASMGELSHDWFLAIHETADMAKAAHDRHIASIEATANDRRA